MKTWATIGSRIEEFAEIGFTKGMKAAKEAIRAQYGDCTEEVYAGLQVFMKHGEDTYYSGKRN